MLERTARWCYSRRRAVLALWIVAFIGFGVVGRLGAGPFSTDFETPGSESKAAHELLKSRFPEQSGDAITVIFKADRGVADPAVRPRLDALISQLRTNPHVVSVVTPYDAEGAQQVSPVDPTIAFATLQLDMQGSDFPVEDAKAMIATAAEANGANSEGGGVRFELGGFAIQNAEFENGGSSEGAGTLAAVVILLIAFGSLLAMGLPILTAVMGIGIGLAIIELLANVVDVPNFTSIVAAMIGLGVGIDYALFIVTRYREGLHAGMDPERATVVAITTAGRAVLFAGTTVVISVLGMLADEPALPRGRRRRVGRRGAGHHDRLRHPPAGHARLRRHQHRPLEGPVYRARPDGPPGRVLVPVEQAHPAPAVDLRAWPVSSPCSCWRPPSSRSGLASRATRRRPTPAPAAGPSTSTPPASVRASPLPC